MEIVGLKKGDIVNSIVITDVIAERVYCSNRLYSTDVIADELPMDDIGLLSEWVICVGVYKSYNDTFLNISLNWQGAVCCAMAEYDMLPNEGIVKVSKEEGKQIEKELKSFGQEFFRYQIKNFDMVLSRMLSIIPCNVSFEPLFNSRDGHYLRHNQSITVANNSSQVMILFGLLHEYTHYLLKDMPERTIKTYGEYKDDPQEYVCNNVAFKVLMHICPELIEELSEEFHNLSGDIQQASHELITLMDLIISEQKSDMYELINELSELIVSKYEMTTETGYKFLPSEAFKLRKDENDKLFSYIMNELSNMISLND